MWCRKSAKAKYRALHHGIMELTRMNILLSELGFGSKQHMILLCDNTTTIDIANNPGQHDQTKHIELDKNYIKDNLDSGKIMSPTLEVQIS